MKRLEQINEALRETDIEGLLAMGAPSDEYMPEAKLIDEELDNVSAWIEVRDLVECVFKKMFDYDHVLDAAKVLKAANAIVKLVCEHPLDAREFVRYAPETKNTPGRYVRVYLCCNCAGIVHDDTPDGKFALKET